MTEEDVKAVVNENIDKMKAMLGLDRWDIDIEYGKTEANILSSGFDGQCTTDTAWVNRALITLDPDGMDDSAEVLDVLQHELVHCITSSYNLCMGATSELVSKKEYRALLALHYRADEEVTTAICNILDSLKPLPREHCTICRKEPTPDSGLIPFSLCRVCFEGMFPELAKEMKEAFKETVTENILDVVKDTPQSV